MTTRILAITSSLEGARGASSRLIEQLLPQLQRTYRQIEIRRRELDTRSTPHVSAATVTAMRTAPQERTAEQSESLQLATTLTNEVFEADVLVLAAPMYNFAIPSTLKAWLDHIAWAGVTFRYTASGPEGLLKGKRAYIVTTRGGIYRDTEGDTVVPYLRQILNFIGITDIHIIYAEGLATQKADQGFESAQAQIAAIAEEPSYATA